MRRDSFERFYYEKVSLEGGGCAELAPACAISTGSPSRLRRVVWPGRHYRIVCPSGYGWRTG
jgi:hypothetical protein